jgi:DDB1- and CUL4-associated factor 13
MSGMRQSMPLTPFFSPSFLAGGPTLTGSRRTEPLLTLSFSETTTSRRSTKDNYSGEHVTSVCFNQSETSVLASTGSDRTLCLFDLRSGSATSRVTMKVKVVYILLDAP